MSSMMFIDSRGGALYRNALREYLLSRIGLRARGEKILNAALKNGCDPEGNWQRRVVAAFLD